MGPTLLFDKSFLESLGVDEAVMLDQMFACVISPLFIAETLGDLAKEGDGKRHPISIIGSLATKTPVCHSYMNTFHERIMLEELLGYKVPMDFRPMVAGGIPVQTEDGLGMVYKLSPEALAFERWRQHRFLDVERSAARVWRRSLAEFDLPAIREAFQSMLRKEHRPKSREEAYRLANGIISAPGQNYRTLLIAHRLLNLPPDSLSDSIRAWRKQGSRSLMLHAPYTAHCLKTDLYFYLCLSNGIISDQRASHKVDMAYLYYAPFANVFVSWDRLHRDHAPSFLGVSQQFVWGPDLKADLKVLNEHFLNLPEDQRAQGLFTLASKPPADHQGLCAKIWDRFRGDWRAPKPRPKPLPPELHSKIIGESNRLISAAELANMPPPPRTAPKFDNDSLERLVLQRSIPRQRGSWRMFSTEIEKAEDERVSNEDVDQA